MSEPYEPQPENNPLDVEAADPTAALTSDDDDDAAAAGSAPVSWPGDLGAGTVRDVAVIRNYRLIEQVGAGGMGVVYKAEQLRPVRRTVALKLIKFGMDTPQVVARFESERQALALLEHPGVARVYDAGATDAGRPYFVMEYVPGKPITEYCDARKLTTRQRLELFMRVCDAVQHAHFRGILHRDLKPSNILVADADDQPQPKVIDFGVAKATQDVGAGGTLATGIGQLVGTPVYMSPEQAAGEDVDTRTDVYSLGVVLYELLAGALPYDPKSLQGIDSQRIVRQILDTDPARPSARLTTLGEASIPIASRRGVDSTTLRRQLRGDLDRVVMKAIDKDRTRRYATAAALAEDVRRHLSHEPVTARPPTLAYQARKFARRNRVLVSASVLVLLALVIGGVLATVGMIRARQALNRETQARQRETQARQAEQTSRLVAESVTEFLRDMLASVNPSRAQGKPVLVRDVLDRAAAELPTRFKDQPVVASRLHSIIADTYHSLALYAAAYEHARAALELRRPVLGEDDPGTLAAAHSMAVEMRVLGRAKEAEAILRDVLERRRRVSGPDAAETLKAEEALALVMLSQGRAAEAEPLMRHALEATRRAGGADHPETLSAMHNMAAIEDELGRYDRSAALYEEVAAARQRVLGPDDPSTIISLNNLAGAMVRLRRPADAERVFRDVLARNQRIHGADHKATLDCMNNLAYTLQELGRSAEAEAMYLDVIARARRSLPENNRTTLSALSNLANAQVSLDKFDEALATHGELYERARAAELPHPIAAKYMMPYGMRLAKLGRYAEAEPPLREARKRLEAANLAESPAMGDVALALAVVCENTGRPDEGARWRADANRLRQPATAPATMPAPRAATAPAPAP